MRNANEVGRVVNAATSRRDFLQGATAVGLTTAFGSSMWSKEAKAAPTKGGHMKVGIGGGATTDSLNPATYDALFMVTLGASMRDNLTEISPDNSLRGALAESWEPSDDAKEWVFNLRKGVEWHNGKSLEAEDVINSLNLHRGEDSASGAKGLMEAVEDIKADGKNTVVIRLKSPSADFPYVLTAYHLNIVPSKDGKAEWESGLGTGVYKLKSFEPGIRAELEINPNRWQQEYGFVDSGELLLINDLNARQNAVSTGEIHAANRVDLKTAHLLEKNPNVRLLDVPGRLYHVMPMNVGVPPFDNVDMRLALKLAIDREDYLNRILKGYGTLGNDSPIGPPYRFFPAGAPQRYYDPDKAKFHAKKAGYGGEPIPLSTADFVFPGAVDAAALYKSHAEKAGINIQVVREPNDGYWSNVWLVKPWLVSYWGARAVEDMILSIAHLSDASWNDTSFKSEKLDQVIIQARAELDDAKRAELYAEAHTIISDQGGSLVPAFANFVAALGKDLHTSDQVSGSWELDGGHCLKRWWLADS